MDGLGLSQAELARRVGISQQAVHKLLAEPGRGSRHIAKIAQALETTAAYLTDLTDDPVGAPPAAASPTIQFISMPVAFPSHEALKQMFEGLLRSMPSVGRDELPHELATLLPIGLARIQGPLRYAETADSDAPAVTLEASYVERPARRRASRR